MRPTVVAWILGVHLVFAPSVSAQQANLDSLRRAHLTAQTRVGELMSVRDSALVWAESRYRAITDARREGGGALRDALRAAQVAADSLAVLDAWFAAAVETERQARATFAAALERNLEAVLVRAELAADQRAKAAALARARALALELTRVQEPFELPATDMPQLRVEPADGPEEIRLKADFLADRAAQLRTSAEVVDQEVKKRLKRTELQTEMQRLVAEVRLFDQARVPPAGSGAERVGAADGGGDGDAPLSTELGSGSGAGEPTDLAPALAERGVDLEGDTGPGVRGDGRRSVIEQLRQLRLSLLRRAEALQARSEEIRSMLRGPP